MFLLCTVVSFSSVDAQERPPAVSGQFYPSNSTELARLVDSFLQNAPEPPAPHRAVALLVPHAGYVYSGQVASHAYALLQNRPIKTIILIGNSHSYLLNTGAVYAQGSFRTPLGTIPINEKLARNILGKTDALEENPDAHVPEHSLEVQLPFLQRSLNDFSIIPILLSGAISFTSCSTIGEAIALSVKELGIADETVIIASSDMSHFPTWANANRADARALKALETFDPAHVRDTVKNLMAMKLPQESCVFCAEEALYTTMFAAQALGADTVSVLNYANSGDSSGDKTRVVGYGAAAFLNSKINNTQRIHPATHLKGASMNDFKISEKSQHRLTAIARESVAYYLQHKKVKMITETDPELTMEAAVFVTLTKHGNLRGCIGTTVAQGPLYEAVNEMAVAAAFQDYRFGPVTQKELNDLHFEISILSPMRRVASADEIKPNIHGVVVKKGTRGGGLFLPQVWKHFDTKEDFLGELCSQKAGLPRDAWKDPNTELYVFTVFAFDE